VTGFGALGLAAVVLFVLVFATAIVRSVRDEHQERDWVAGRATVLESRPWRHDRTDAPHGSYVVRARLQTRDGRAVEGWAEGNYDKADRWVGSTRPAWHHPAQVDRFRLDEPRGAMMGLVSLLPALLVVGVALAVFVLIALAMWR
jgi:hypothetical protein